MGSINNILGIAKLAMMAQQTAIQVTAHNIANVNTKGYSRQEVVFEETTPLNWNPGQIGTGVNAAAILRKYDSFIEGQITDNRESYGNLDIQRYALTNIENLFYDSYGAGIDNLLNDFFSAMQDLSANPSGTPERVALLSKADALADAINNIYSDLFQLQKDMNNQVNQTINDINSITEQIADLNVKISQAETAGHNANDYRDMRGKLMNDLAELVDIQYFEDNTGQVTIIGGGTALLVERGNSWDLGTEINSDNNDYYNIIYNPGGNNSVDLTNNITNGKLKGLITIRDTTLNEIIDDIDRLAASVANEINQVHRGGFGLDGSTDNDFFTPSFKTGDPVSVTGFSTNSGTGDVSVTIIDPTLLTYHNYELTFSANGSDTIYTITNKTTNVSTSGTYTTIPPTSPTFQGLTFNITGTHDPGDKYTVSAHKDAAKNLQVAISTDETYKIAAAMQAVDNGEDNRNILTLVGLQDKLSVDGASTFNGYYSSVVGEIGANSQYVNNSSMAQKFSLEQLDNMRESVSGVSMDEEMANLMKYQNAYEAAARLITVSDELLQTLLNILG
ncbi:MAG TPA: flagellar hook-associated protein FlgK [Nitrospiraceae bacterium]|nr:flagellar hook-associated protein FlgK [Nitrospiraceae bacterium]